MRSDFLSHLHDGEPTFGEELIIAFFLSHLHDGELIK